MPVIFAPESTIAEFSPFFRHDALVRAVQCVVYRQSYRDRRPSTGRTVGYIGRPTEALVTLCG